MARAFTVDLGVFALKNVPDEGYDVARQNGQRIQAEAPARAVLTETWHADTKRGIRDGCPTLDWWTEDGQTLMLGHDPKRVKIIERHVLKGASSPRIPWVCDKRDALAELGEDLETGGLAWVVGLHPSPIRPKLGRLAVLAATASHITARRRIRRFKRRLSRGLPMFVAGDFNTTRLFPRAQIAGGDIGNGIVHIEAFHGTVNPIGRPIPATPVKMFADDHLAVHAKARVF